MGGDGLRLNPFVCNMLQSTPQSSWRRGPDWVGTLAPSVWGPGWETGDAFLFRHFVLTRDGPVSVGLKYGLVLPWARTHCLHTWEVGPCEMFRGRGQKRSRLAPPPWPGVRGHRKKSGRRMVLELGSACISQRPVVGLGTAGGRRGLGAASTATFMKCSPLHSWLAWGRVTVPAQLCLSGCNPTPRAAASQALSCGLGFRACAAPAGSARRGRQEEQPRGGWVVWDAVRLYSSLGGKPVPECFSVSLNARKETFHWTEAQGLHGASGEVARLGRAHRQMGRINRKSCFLSDPVHSDRAQRPVWAWHAEALSPPSARVVCGKRSGHCQRGSG